MKMYSIISMPKSRIADYHLEFNDFTVCLDFMENEEGLIYMRRISFDGYGCCEVNSPNTNLNPHESNLFVNQFKSGVLNQDLTKSLVEKLITTNSEYIWEDALKASAIFYI